MITIIYGPQGSGKNKKAIEMIGDEPFEEVVGVAGYKKHILRNLTKEMPKNLILDEFELKDSARLFSLHEMFLFTQMQNVYVLVQCSSNYINFVKA